MSSRTRSLVVALIAIVVLGLSLRQLHAAGAGLRVRQVTIADTPVTIFSRQTALPGPVVILVHGFAGSQQLMQPFATTLARGGYTAVTFDLPGHGRNPTPLTGSITNEDGATRTLIAALTAVAAGTRSLGDGRLAVLGHSMATDVVIRFSEETPDVAATIAVSMFSPAVTADQPRNLLVIVGDLESSLKKEALRAADLATAPLPAAPGVTYGNPGAGTGRRVAFSARAEHVGVLYSRASMREALAWLDAAFGITRSEAPYLDARGPWILALLFGIVLLAYPLTTLLPVVSAPPVGAALRGRGLLFTLVAPALLTPVLLRVLPTHFLPVLVGDYLAVHFAMYGLLTALCLRWASRTPPRSGRVARGALIVAAAALTLYAIAGFGGAIDTYVTSFRPSLARLPLILAMLVGTLSFFLTDEWITRGAGAARGAYVASKVAFVVSLAIAVSLDFQRLLFLVIIVPVVVIFFVIFGLFSRWSYRRTGHPFVGGIASAAGFAWAIGVTFPLIAG